MTRTEIARLLRRGTVQWRYDDLDRDLDNAVEHDELTLRVGYRQVFRDGCATAEKVGAVLNRRGWPGRVNPCAECGALDQAG